MKILSRILLVALALAVAACSSYGGKQKSSGKDSEMSGAQYSGIGNSERFYGEDVTEQEEKQLQAKKVVYFGYDSFSVPENEQKIVLAHAKKLLENPNLRLRVSGHTDERGSRAYNIALGERRAKAISKILSLKGISKDRVSVVSYGKEKPVALGHDEDSWSLNRRSNLFYEGEDEGEA